MKKACSADKIRRARGTKTQVNRELVGLAVVYDLFSNLLKDFIICSVLCVGNCIFLRDAKTQFFHVYQQ